MEYFSNLKVAFKRPYINGVDGKYFKRGSDPLELFFDLIFVVTLAKISNQLHYLTPSNIFYSFILFVTLFLIWYNVTKYAMYFISNKSDYFLRTMIFLVMIPVLLISGINDYSSPEAIRILAGLIGITRLICAYIWRDAIINAPINHIATSKKYKFVSQRLKVSAGVTLLGIIFPEQFIIFLIISLILETIFMPIVMRKKHNKGLIDFDTILFNERKLLFVILIFGEAITKTFSVYDITAGLKTAITPLMIFAIIYLFFLRLNEETQIRNTKKETTSIYLNAVFNFFLILLFSVLTVLENSQLHGEEISFFTISVLVFILTYISVAHYINNYISLKKKSQKIKPLRNFYVLDQTMNILMLLVAMIILIFHPTGNIVIFEVLIFFFLHSVAVPLRFQFI